MIGDSGISDSAKINGIEIAELVEAILGHHPAGLEISLATPIKMLPGESYVKTPPGGLENAKTFGHDLASDAVPFNDCDLVAIHNSSPNSLAHEVIHASAFHPSIDFKVQASFRHRKLENWRPRD